jgi:hypothetical protein
MAYLRLTATKCHICHGAVSPEECDVDERMGRPYTVPATP